MSATTAHAAGTFCWPELNTSDVPAAKAFYAGLFGWTSQDSTMPQGGVYSMLKFEGQDVGAVASMQEEHKAAGVPPHWMSYTAVADADATAQAATALGGTVVAGPFDVMEIGRMAIIQDPTGAMFSLWQPKSHAGAPRLNQLGSLAWTELYTTDPARASAFYTGLFKWEPKEWEGPNAYTVFHFPGEERMAGGMLEITDEMKGVPPNWLPYFQVEDTDRAAARAKELGGSVSVPPMDVPGAGRIAIMADPQGAMFGVIG